MWTSVQWVEGMQAYIATHSLIEQFAHHGVPVSTITLLHISQCPPHAPLLLLSGRKWIFSAEYASAVQSAPTKKSEVPMLHLQTGTVAAVRYNLVCGSNGAIVAKFDSVFAAKIGTSAVQVYLWW